jgi:hypothetical protein
MIKEKIPHATARQDIKFWGWRRGGGGQDLQAEFCPHVQHSTVGLEDLNNQVQGQNCLLSSQRHLSSCGGLMLRLTMSLDYGGGLGLYEKWSRPAEEPDEGGVLPPSVLPFRLLHSSTHPGLSSSPSAPAHTRWVLRVLATK